MKLENIKSSYLKTPVLLLKKHLIIDEFGINKAEYSELKNTRGWLLTSNYKKQEFLSAQGINSIDSKELVIRFTDLTYKDVVSIKNVKYEILSIENVEEKSKFLSLLIAVVNDG